MADYTEQNPLDYTPHGDTVDEWGAKYVEEMPRIYKILNELRRNASNGMINDPAPYQFKVDASDNKLYIRDGANENWILLGNIEERFGFAETGEKIITSGMTATAGGTANKVVLTNEDGKLVVDIMGDASTVGGINPKTIIVDDDVATKGTAGKLITANADGKLDTDITGDAATVGGILPKNIIVKSSTAETATAGKLLFVNEDGKMDTDITGDAVTVGGIKAKDILTTADIATQDNEAGKIYRTNEAGVIPASITGNAAKLADKVIITDNLQDGQVLTYRSATNTWSNENKGVIGSGKALTIKKGSETLAEYSGEEATEIDIDPSADIEKHNTAEDAHAGTVAKLNEAIKDAIAGSPNYYEEDKHWHGGAADARTTLYTPTRLWLNINDVGYQLKEQKSYDISTDAAWDANAVTWQKGVEYKLNDVVYPAERTGYYYRCTTAGTSSETLVPAWPTTVGETEQDNDVVWTCELDYTDANNRHGKDFYIYACVPKEGTVPNFVISANSTVPSGYTADTSRKIGGFHCLCVDAGDNISDHNNIHPLTNYLAGDIIPASVWDLKHRPKCDPEGMAYDEGTDMWYSIYLLSQEGTRGTDSSTDTHRLVSKYQGVSADGTSNEIYHCWKFEQELSRQKMRLPWQSEFLNFSLGSNQGTNVAGSADVNTTGGFKDTAGRRMISNIGLEDCCGNLWQWGADTGSASYGNSWHNGFDGNDHYVAGQVYWEPYRVLLGGSADDGACCGSRGSDWDNWALYVGWYIGARGASEPA